MATPESGTPGRSVLLMGAGYVGTALAKELNARGVRCSAAVASRQSAERLDALGIDNRRLDLDSAQAPIALPKVTQVVYLVPPKRSSDTDERLDLLLSQLPDSVETFVYISTSGVYGDQQGRSVDEATPPAPHSARARRRLDAEHRVQAHCTGHLDWIIARVPGIYGPGRLPLQSLRDARPVINEHEANPGNRIHRDDLAFVIAECLHHAYCQRRDGQKKHRQREDEHTRDQQAPLGEIYNTGDGCHMSSTAFACEVAHQAGLNPPPQISRQEMKATASSVRWSFMAESRRLDSTKLHQLLTKPLRYTDPVEGIRASLEQGDDAAA